jgi:hypothetical protein
VQAPQDWKESLRKPWFRNGHWSRNSKTT